MTLNLSFFGDRVNLIRQIYQGRYLLVFQNNSELRPSGGFIGSYAVADTKLLRLDNMQINTNIYKYDDKYDYVLQIEPPRQFLQTVLGDRKYWAMRDSNWSVDFAKSAQNVAWFYREEGGSAVDGVIAINASVVRDLLGIIGPIKLKDENVTIDENNFFNELYNQIEVVYYQDPANRANNEPKKILNEMYPILLDRIKQKQYRLEVIKLIIQEFRQRHIQFYSPNNLIEQAFRWFNISGEIKQTKTADYLYINNANLAGNKSSFNVDQKVVLNTFIDDDGNITDTINITRSHRGTGIWPDGDNFNYQRLIVPKGSVLLKTELDDKDISQDVETTEESNKTVFGYWFNITVGSSKTAKIIYRLPKKIKKIDGYSLFWQKQSGVISDYLEVIINDQKTYAGDTKSDQLIK